MKRVVKKTTNCSVIQLNKRQNRPYNSIILTFAIIIKDCGIKKRS